MARVLKKATKENRPNPGISLKLSLNYGEAAACLSSALYPAANLAGDILGVLQVVESMVTSPGSN
jgi:hypothetical protein